MMKDLARIKKTFTDKTEVEYRSRGYEVSRDVALDFYPDFRADLLASRKGENQGYRGANPNRNGGDFGYCGLVGSNQAHARLEL